MASIKHGHDTPHYDISDIRNKCKLITYPFAVVFIPYLKFLCPIVSFSFHQLRQFLLLERLAGAHTNCQQTLSNCPYTDSASEMTYIVSGGALNSTHSTPCTDTNTTLWRHCPKLLSHLLLHSLTRIESSHAVVILLCHVYLFSLLETFYRQKFSCKFYSLVRHFCQFFVQYLYKNSLPGVKFVLWHIFWEYNQLFSPLW